MATLTWKEFIAPNSAAFRDWQANKCVLMFDGWLVEKISANGNVYLRGDSQSILLEDDDVVDVERHPATPASTPPDAVGAVRIVVEKVLGLWRYEIFVDDVSVDLRDGYHTEALARDVANHEAKKYHKDDPLIVEYGNGYAAGYADGLKEYDAMQAELADCRAQLAAARGALKPFADVAAWIDPTKPSKLYRDTRDWYAVGSKPVYDDLPLQSDHERLLHTNDLFKAAEVLDATEGKQS